MKILLLNGPNMTLLGKREPTLYGTESFSDLLARFRAYAAEKGVGVTCLASDTEGDLVAWIGQASGRYDGIIINPAALTHTSVALRDALCAVSLPTVEVHITDPATREPFRRVDYVRDVCLAAVVGEGTDGYLRALDILIRAIGGGNKV